MCAIYVSEEKTCCLFLYTHTAAIFIIPPQAETNMANLFGKIRQHHHSVNVQERKRKISLLLLYTTPLFEKALFTIVLNREIVYF